VEAEVGRTRMTEIERRKKVRKKEAEERRKG